LRRANPHIDVALLQKLPVLARRAAAVGAAKNFSGPFSWLPLTSYFGSIGMEPAGPSSIGALFDVGSGANFPQKRFRN